MSAGAPWSRLPAPGWTELARWQAAGAATLASSRAHARSRGQERPLPRESTKETVTPLRRESRDVPAEPVVLTRVLFFRRRGYGRRRRPAFPAPCQRGGR